MAKEKKPIQDITPEENVITAEEFEELEKKEKGSGIPLRKEAKREPPKKGFFERGGETSQDRLVLDIEKIQAKLETNEGLRQATEEKITRISEEIGELRSAILEKERTFNQLEGGFEKVKEIFEEIQPRKIRTELERKDEAIEKANAKVETLSTRFSELKKSVDEIISIMDKIKDLKNLTDISGKITAKMAKIEDDKKDSAKTAAKIESMFSELSEKLAEFHKYRDKIDFSSDSMHDLMKAIDMIEVKLDNALTKDDAKKLDDKFESMEKDYSAKIQTTRDIVDDLVTSLKKGGVKELLAKEGKTRVDEINKRLSEMGSYDKSIDSLKNEIAKLREEKTKDIGSLVSEIQRLKSIPQKEAKPKEQKKEPKQAFVPLSATRSQSEAQPQAYGDNFAYPQLSEEDLNSLIEKCHTHIDRGEPEQARSLYTQILSIYESSKNNPESQEAYGKIKRLYYRLQIHQ